MTLEIVGTRNYSATVIRVPELRKAQNSDRLYSIDKLGMTAIVDASWLDKVGELALIFPAEVQISHLFAQRNNLFRHSELNDDVSQAGYLEDNRRVRALKLRGNISNALVLPLSSVGYLRAGVVPINEGDVFDTIAGEEICRKYVIETKATGLTRGERQVKKAFKRVDETFLPMHFDTSHWDREEHRIDRSETVIVTQKLHGTSVRLANTVVKRQLTWLEKIAQKLGVAVKDHDYDLVAGSRKVIKDPNNPNQKHHYGSDVWTDALGDFGQKIPKNHIIYGELVGFVTNAEGDISPIQKGHTYECVRDGIMIGERNQLYVYRVAVVTEDGDLIDMSWNQVKAFCVRHGLKHTPELLVCKKGDLYLDTFEELDFWEKHQQNLAHDVPSYNETPVKLSHGGTGKDEGVVIRVESGMVPEFFKFKNKSHYLYESSQLDSGEADIESLG